jgi:hypothetical protein
MENGKILYPLQEIYRLRIEMASVTLKLRDILGKNHTITVPNDIQVGKLIDRIAHQLRRPIGRISHAGRYLEKDRLLSDYYFINFNDVFYIHTPMNSGFQPSIVHMNAQMKARRNRILENHLANLRSTAPRGATMAYRSGVKKALRNAGREIPNNIEDRILNYVGGKRKTRKSKKSRRKTRRSS